VVARESGQATVEAVVAVSLLVLAGTIALQLLVAGYALALADGAAEAGALALAAERPAKEAVRESLPSWARDDAEVSVHGGEVTLRLTPPLLLPGVGDVLTVDSSAYARPAGR
jgi:hypothetical protein